jgi:hypothetical protein
MPNALKLITSRREFVERDAGARRKVADGSAVQAGDVQRRTVTTPGDRGARVAEQGSKTCRLRTANVNVVA